MSLENGVRPKEAGLKFRGLQRLDKRRFGCMIRSSLRVCWDGKIPFEQSEDVSS